MHAENRTDAIDRRDRDQGTVRTGDVEVDGLGIVAECAEIVVPRLCSLPNTGQQWSSARFVEAVAGPAQRSLYARWSTCFRRNQTLRGSASSGMRARIGAAGSLHSCSQRPQRNVSVSGLWGTTMRPASDWQAGQIAGKIIVSPEYRLKEGGL